MKIKELIELDWCDKCIGSTMNPEYIPRTKFEDRTANGLTRCIIRFIELHGGQAERISNTGRYLDSTKVVTDSLGHKKTIGTGKYIKGTGTNGTADISAIIKGHSYKIEVKIGKDRQSEAQRKYQEATERAGGTYLIATSFEQITELL